MPPKVKVTKEAIVDAAFSIVRESGAAAVNARTVAARLNCSTQPVFSNFAAMDKLHLAVIEKAEALYRTYTDREVESGDYPRYKASGMAYIRFAREEKELFKLLYMRDRTGEEIPMETELTDEMEALVQNNVGLDGMTAKLFHLEIWAYVHGIAAMFATGYLELEWSLVSKMLTDAYEGLKKQYGMEGEKWKQSEQRD